jgi:hypothetical protein
MAFRDLQFPHPAGQKKMPRPFWRFAAGTRNFVRLLLLLMFRARFAGPPPQKVEAVSKGESVEQIHHAIQKSPSPLCFESLLNLVDYTEARPVASSALRSMRSGALITGFPGALILGPAAEADFSQDKGRSRLALQNRG